MNLSRYLMAFVITALLRMLLSSFSLRKPNCWLSISDSNCSSIVDKVNCSGLLDVAGGAVFVVVAAGATTGAAVVVLAIA